MNTLPVDCVVDASVAIKLLLLEDYTSEVQAYFLRMADDVTASAPDLLLIECSNILWRQVRFNGYDTTQAQCDQRDLLALNIQYTPTTTLLPRALAISMTYGATVYDACYVALAELLQVPLLTADNRLIAQLKDAPYAVLTLDALLPAVS
ncbi:MAG: type II toxin-antitoxin system VapC family toxin [Armatimonadota bacterium]